MLLIWYDPFIIIFFNSGLLFFIGLDFSCASHHILLSKKKFCSSKDRRHFSQVFDAGDKIIGGYYGQAKDVWIKIFSWSFHFGDTKVSQKI